MPHLTSLQRSADALLRERGTDLERFLREHQAAGYSLEGISRELYDITGGAVSVTFSTIRRWLADLLEVAS